MKIRLKFFASYREVIGKKEMELDLKEGKRLADLLQHLYKKYPRLEAFKEGIICSINKEYAPLDAKLKEGDEVALLPPVSGG